MLLSEGLFLRAGDKGTWDLQAGCFNVVLFEIAEFVCGYIKRTEWNCVWSELIVKCVWAVCFVFVNVGHLEPEQK